jgi:hypothetical protein
MCKEFVVASVELLTVMFLGALRKATKNLRIDGLRNGIWTRQLSILTRSTTTQTCSVSRISLPAKFCVFHESCIAAM